MVNEGEKGIIDRILMAKKSNPFVQDSLRCSMPNTTTVTESMNYIPESSALVHPVYDIPDPDIDSVALEESTEVVSNFSVPTPLHIRKNSDITKSIKVEEPTKLNDSKEVKKVPVSKQAKRPIHRRVKMKESTNTVKGVTVNTNKYVGAHGKEPRGGYGMWMFSIGGDEVAFSGTYATARDLAVQYAKKVKVSTVYVLS